MTISYCWTRPLFVSRPTIKVTGYTEQDHLLAEAQAKDLGFVWWTALVKSRQGTLHTILLNSTK